MTRLILGDCLDAMRELEPESADAIVTDPPYGLSFMGKEWDHGVPGEPFWREALRVAKPGAHLLAFGGTRTHHRLACAIEDAGWEMRDTLSWLYGSGFPKSLDVSKALDATALHGGSNSRRIRQASDRPGAVPSSASLPNNGVMSADRRVGMTGGEPQTDLAKQWAGWGTALKPAWEPIILARKPLIGTVAANVAAHGTGALNIDGCRIGHASASDLAASQAKNPGRDDLVTSGVYGAGRPQQRVTASGRWPANVCLDEEAAAALDAQSGERPVGNSRGLVGGKDANGAGMFGSNGKLPTVAYADTGGASRFFYTAKASRREREAGLDGIAPRLDETGCDGDMPTDDDGNDRDRFKKIARNVHPTVKPLALMRWLCRLVTPPAGVVLDPFMGSGTTGCAAAMEGFQFIGCEREAEYVEIAGRRIAHWQSVALAAQPSLNLDGVA